MNTNNDMLGLLNLAYEIEGLLLLNINRGDEASPEMKSLLTAKAGQLYAGLSAVTPAVSSTISGASVAAQTKSATVVKEEANGMVTPSASIPESMTETEAAAEIEATETAAQVRAEVTAVEASDASAVAKNVLEEERGDANITPTVNDTLAVETQQTLDEKLARQRAADISKAFTLNDRFRFRRELFRNSDEEFRETLEVIGSMSSMEEAEDYFFNDLCWDESAPEVKEFMEIVAKHF